MNKLKKREVAALESIAKSLHELTAEGRAEGWMDGHNSGFFDGLHTDPEKFYSELQGRPPLKKKKTSLKEHFANAQAEIAARVKARADANGEQE